MRLDFSNFVITGPSTFTNTQAEQLNGNLINPGAGKAVSFQSQCL